jgi:hypothetical protein
MAMFDKGDDNDESLPITFVRGWHLEHLTIEALVDLAIPKLITRFQDVLTASAATDRATKRNINKLVGSRCTMGVEGRSGLVKDT